MEYLPMHADEFDVVVNTSLANSIELSKLCIRLGLDYIDVGIEAVVVCPVVVFGNGRANVGSFIVDVFCFQFQAEGCQPQ